MENLSMPSWHCLLFVIVAFPVLSTSMQGWYLEPYKALYDYAGVLTISYLHCWHPLDLVITIMSVDKEV